MHSEKRDSPNPLSSLQFVSEQLDRLSIFGNEKKSFLEELKQHIQHIKHSFTHGKDTMLFWNNPLRENSQHGLFFFGTVLNHLFAPNGQTSIRISVYVEMDLEKTQSQPEETLSSVLVEEAQAIQSSEQLRIFLTQTQTALSRVQQKLKAKAFDNYAIAFLISVNSSKESSSNVQRRIFFFDVPVGRRCETAIVNFMKHQKNRFEFYSHSDLVKRRKIIKKEFDRKENWMHKTRKKFFILFNAFRSAEETPHKWSIQFLMHYNSRLMRIVRTRVFDANNKMDSALSSHLLSRLVITPSPSSTLLSSTTSPFSRNAPFAPLLCPETASDASFSDSEATSSSPASQRSDRSHQCEETPTFGSGGQEETVVGSSQEHEETATENALRKEETAADSSPQNAAETHQKVERRLVGARQEDPYEFLTRNTFVAVESDSETEGGEIGEEREGEEIGERVEEKGRVEGEEGRGEERRGEEDRERDDLATKFHLSVRDRTEKGDISTSLPVKHQKSKIIKKFYIPSSLFAEAEDHLRLLEHSDTETDTFSLAANLATVANEFCAFLAKEKFDEPSPSIMRQETADTANTGGETANTLEEYAKNQESANVAINSLPLETPANFSSSRVFTLASRDSMRPTSANECIGGVKKGGMRTKKKRLIKKGASSNTSLKTRTIAASKARARTQIQQEIRASNDFMMSLLRQNFILLQQIKRQNYSPLLSLSPSQ